jgi:hypothetical protein
MLVVAVGDNSEWGKTISLVTSSGDEQTPLQVIAQVNLQKLQCRLQAASHAVCSCWQPSSKCATCNCSCTQTLLLAREPGQRESCCRFEVMQHQITNVQQQHKVIAFVCWGGGCRLTKPHLGCACRRN